MPTIPIETRIDTNDLATLTEHYRPAHLNLTKSKIVRLAVQDLIARLQIEGTISPSTDTEQAFQYLDKAGMDLNRKNAKVAIAKTIVQEEEVKPKKSVEIPDRYRLIDAVGEALKGDMGE